MGSKYLSEVLNGQEIVNEGNQLICILSGVGSGKNTFIEKELSKYGNILYISSRRAKVNEILENKLCSDTINWDNEISDVVCVTNYGIERIVKNEMFQENLHQIISHFDFIVVDEVHSLFSDATYATSSFHVLRFIEYVADKYPSIKIVVMTGTPEPIEGYLKQKKYKIYDKRDICINVLPKAIRIVDKEYALSCIQNLPKNEKTIYYSNSATKIVKGENSLVAKACEFGYSMEEIGVCISESSV